MKKSEWHGTFADKLRGYVGVGLPPWWSYEAERAGFEAATISEVGEEVKQTFMAIREAQVFVADNVAEYLYGGTDQEVWGPEDFPCVAPPFELFWVEYKRPTRVLSEVYGETKPSDTAAKRTGWLVYASPRPEDEEGWILSGTCLLEFDDNSYEAERLGSTVLWTGVQLHVLLRADGSIEDVSPTGSLYPASMPKEEAEKHVGVFATALGPTFWTVLLALTFINCSNVPRHVVSPPEALLRRDAKRGELRPRSSYHVLDIGPMQRVLHTEGGVREHGNVQRALHVCRGHFKTYTEDAPLFGRVVGTYWWGPQARGSKSVGEVEKDYRVKGVGNE